MLYQNKDNNQHIYIIKKHDSIHNNKSNIYTISYAYRKLSTHLTQKQQNSKLISKEILLTSRR